MCCGMLQRHKIFLQTLLLFPSTPSTSTDHHIAQPHLMGMMRIYEKFQTGQYWPINPNLINQYL